MITLGQYIEYYDRAGRQLEADYASAQSMQGTRRDIYLRKLDSRRAVLARIYFSDDAEAKRQSIADLYDWYAAYVALVFEAEMPEGYVLPKYQLWEGSEITFGQFIDAKLSAQMAKANDRSVWHLAHNLCAIFLEFHTADRCYFEYLDIYVAEHSDKYRDCFNVPLPCGIHAINFYNNLNTYISEHFSLFDESVSDDSGRHMRKHMQQWGWVRFQNSIAEAKVFDRNGLTSIDSARAAKLVDVLAYADEKQQYNMAQNNDMKLMYQTK